MIGFFKDIGGGLLHNRIVVVSQLILWTTMSIVYSSSFVGYVFYVFFILSVIYLYFGLNDLSKKSGKRV